MQDLFLPQYWWIWAVVLWAALFWPVRQLIWVLQVRREERILGQPPEEGVSRTRRQRRASLTSALICLVFSILYVNVLFGRLYGF